MRREPSGPADRPFTLVACMSCRSSTDDALMNGLRETVRGCPHGVLVATSCLDGAVRCPRVGGVAVVAQSCTRDRAPDGPAVAVGPLVTEVDVQNLGAWLRAGLPAGLHALPGARPVGERS